MGDGSGAEGYGRRLLWQGVSVGSLLVLLYVAHLFRPFYWYVDDKRNQYVPIFADIGRRLLNGEFPAIDPNLGPSGNYSLDTQYSIYDPMHLLLSVVVSRFHNFASAGFFLAALYLVVLAWGVTALVQRLGVRGPFAALLGLGSASGGYAFFWLANDWIPGLIGLAFVPWLWWAWLDTAPAAGSPGTRWHGLRVRRLPLVTVFSFLVIASGWPSTWMVFVGLTGGLLLESVLTRDRAARWTAWVLPLLCRALAALAGLLLAVIGLLPIMNASSWTIRDQFVANTNQFTINFADFLAFAMPWLHGDLETFNHNVTTSNPIFFFGWFLLPLLCLMRWDRLADRAVSRSPGFVTAMTGALLLLMATQLPSVLGPVRDQFRQLAGAQFFVLLALGVLAWRTGLVLSRGRLMALTLSWVAMGYLAWARTPTQPQSVVGALAAGVVLALVVVGWRFAGWRGFAAVGLLGSIALTTVSIVLTPVPRETPVSVPRPGVLDLTRADSPAFAVYPFGNNQVWSSWYQQGFGRAFAHLTAQERVMPGYSSVGQKHWRELFLVGRAQGETRRGTLDVLLATEPHVVRDWADLLGLRTLIVNRRFVKHARNQLPPTWVQEHASRDFVVFHRTTAPDVAGRVTYAGPGVHVRQVAVSNSSQTYHVTAPHGGILVMRDVFWPGYHATVGGRPLAVHPFRNVLVSVRVPAGTDADVHVYYRPVPYRDAAALVLAALVALAVSMLGPLLRRRRAGHLTAEPSADPVGAEDAAP